jgi:hypothetical protein
VNTLDTKDSLYQVATGALKEPKLEFEINGEVQVFEGRDARVFAFGMLAGIKAEQEGSNLTTTIDGKEV